MQPTSSTEAITLDCQLNIILKLKCSQDSFYCTDQLHRASWVNVIKNPPWNLSETLLVKPVLCLLKVAWDLSSPVYWYARKIDQRPGRPGKVKRHSCRRVSPTVSTKQWSLALILPLGLQHQSSCCMKLVSSWNFCCYLASLRAVFGTASLMSLGKVYGVPGHF